MAVLNFLAFSDADFAHGVVYTYGPLGFLVSRFYWPDTYEFQVLWWACSYAAICWGYFLIARGLYWPFAALGALALIIFGLETTSTDSWMLAAAAALVFGYAVPKPEALRASSAWALVAFAAVAGLTKFTFFLSGGLLILTLDLYRWYHDRSWPLLFPAWFIGSFILWAIIGQPPLNFVAFIASRLEITSGYADVLSIAGPGLEIVIYMSACVAIGIFIVLGFRHRSVATRVFLITGTAIVLYIAFKTGYIRHANRVMATEVLVFTSIFLALGVGQRKSWGAFILGVVLIIGAASVHISSLIIRERIDAGERIVLQANGALDRAKRAISLLSRPGYFKRRHERALRLVQEQFPLPALEGGVDYLGVRNAILIAHGFHWAGRPVFQDYQAYNPALMELNAAFYRSQEAPRYILVEMDRFANTPGLLLDSGAYSEMLARYRFKNEYGPIALFERCERPRLIERTVVAEAELDIGESFALGSIAESPLWLEAEVSITMTGRLLGTLFKRPELRALMRLENGSATLYRFPPAAGEAGFLISPRIDTQGQLIAAAANGLDHLLPQRGLKAIRFESKSPYVDWVYRGVKLKFYRFQIVGHECLAD